MLQALADIGPFTEAITPYLPVIGILFGGLLVGAFAIWNRKRGNMETRAPDVNELWQQQRYQAKELDSEVKLRRRAERFADELVRVFRGYVRRVQGGGSNRLTPHERLFHDADSPSGLTPTQPPE